MSDRWLLTLLALALAACGETAPPPDVLVLDSTWRSMAGSEGELVDLRVSPAGRVAALDAVAPAVVVLSPDGLPTGWLGRAGEGPGELSPRSLLFLVLTDTSVLVPDLMQQRLTELSWQGEVLASRPLPAGGGYQVDWVRGDGGGLVFRALDPQGDVVLRASGAGVDTLHRFPPGDPRPNLLLPPVNLWALSGSRLAVARSDAWVVDMYDLSTGERVWRVARDVGPERLGPGARRHLAGVVEASVTREAGGQAPSPAQMDAILAQVTFPDVAPVLAGLMAAPSGDVWVREVRSVEEMDREALRVGSAEGYGGEVWSVLDGRGSSRRRVRLPPRFQPRDFYGPWLYGLWTDDLGVPRPARVRVPSSPRNRGSV